MILAHHATLFFICIEIISIQKVLALSAGYFYRTEHMLCVTLPYLLSVMWLCHLSLPKLGLSNDMYFSARGNSSIVGGDRCEAAVGVLGEEKNRRSSVETSPSCIEFIQNCAVAFDGRAGRRGPRLLQCSMATSGVHRQGGGASDLQNQASWP